MTLNTVNDAVHYLRDNQKKNEVNAQHYSLSVDKCNHFELQRNVDFHAPYRISTDSIALTSLIICLPYVTYFCEMFGKQSFHASACIVLYCYLWEEKSLLGLQLPKESCWQGIYSANSSILNRILVFNTLNANA